MGIPKPDKVADTWRNGASKSEGFTKTGNAGGKPKYDLVDTRTGEVVPKPLYHVRWLATLNGRYRRAAKKAQAVLEAIMMDESEATRDRLAAIKEINSRILGQPDKSISVSGKVQHEHTTRYVQLLQDMHERLSHSDHEKLSLGEVPEPITLIEDKRSSNPSFFSDAKTEAFQAKWQELHQDEKIKSDGNEPKSE